MKKRLLALLLAFAITIVSIPFGTMQVSAAEIPSGAPFTAITTDAGEVSAIKEMSTVTYSGYSTYENVPYYHVTIPEGATEVYVTHPSSEDPFADTSYGSAYGYYAETTGWTGGGMSYAFEEAEDGYKITLPLSKTAQDWSTGETYELSFVADEDGYVSHAVAVERNDYSPIAFFTFEYAPGCEHSYTSVVTAPTCTEGGYTTHTCSLCGDSYTDSTTEATGHSYEDDTCSVCGAIKEVERTFTKIVAGETTIEESAIEYKGIFELGDDYDGDDDGYNFIHKVPYYIVTVPLGTETVDITYTADADIMNSGSDAYGYRTYLTSDEIDLTASASVKGTTFKNAYTVNEDGTQTVTTSVKNNTIDANGTRWAITLEGTDSTFAALTLFSFEYPQHEHTYNADVTAPTCDKAGYTTYTCTGCFDSYVADTTEAAGHDYEAAVTEATCVTDGYTTYTCSSCGDSYTEEGEKAAGHTKDESIDPVVTQPTCTVNGSTQYTCSECGNTYLEPIIAPGHTMAETVVAPTCTQQGYTLHACTECDYEYKDTYTEITGHDYEGNNCSVCGAPAEVDGAYQIGSEAALRWFETYVEAGNTTANAKLAADITVESSWDGIGTSSKRFAGSFDGNGKTVTFKNATNGLFAYVKGASATNYAEIKNVTIDGAISGNSKVAGIAGYALNVKIENCINAATVQGTNSVAGIVGAALGINDSNCTVVINNCGNTGFVEGTGSSNSTGVAGIVGDTRGGTTISNCYNSGNVSGKGDTGGIAGYIQGYKGACTVTNCYNTGKIEGGTNSGGIIGNLYNGVTVTNCYNTGESTYAIAGNVYNKTAKVSNTYYLASASTEAVPASDMFDTISVESKTSKAMSSEAFAALLGEAFKASCPSPVFTTQTAAEHTMTDGVCSVCNYGSSEKETYTVTIPTGTGYTVTGDTTATEGEEYTFTVTIAEDYMEGENFAVTVTNGTVAKNDDGSYTVTEFNSNFTINVSGVVAQPTEFTITLPKLGNGYAVNADTTTVNRGENFTFTVTFANGFTAGGSFAVKANGTALAAVDGVYTIENVRADQTITVEGVEMVPYTDTADVTFTIAKGTQELYTADATDTIMAIRDMEVPYFDLADYGLEKFYYNPYCYLDKDGNPVAQSAGTKETAYGKVTAMHAFIYATEVFYLGYDAEDAGTGLSYITDTDKDGTSDFAEAISWTQDAGSSFMNLWGFGENLNYYVNYTYPLGKAKWGSTSDQIVLKDGDIFTVHMITGSASGSNFPFFVANDDNGQFDISDQATHYGTTVTMYDQVDTATVQQGEELELTLYLANPAEYYTTAYTKQTGKTLYMTADGDMTSLVVDDEEGWTATEYVTDENGKVVIDTAELEPGTYYFAAEGGLTAGGQDLGDGFITKGGETGVAVFKLVVEESTAPAPESFEVKVPVADGYTVTGDTSVDYGATYEFTVEISDGYEMNDDFAVKVNGITIMPDENGVYKVIDVTTALEITVEGVVEIVETPTVKPGDLDGDGELTYKEVLTTLAAFRGKSSLTAEQFNVADIDGNGELTYKEVLTILKNFRTDEQGE